MRKDKTMAEVVSNSRWSIPLAYLYRLDNIVCKYMPVEYDMLRCNTQHIWKQMAEVV